MEASLKEILHMLKDSTEFFGRTEERFEHEMKRFKKFLELLIIKLYTEIFHLT